jgi:hypothetical protein
MAQSSGYWGHVVFWAPGVDSENSTCARFFDGSTSEAGLLLADKLLAGNWLFPRLFRTWDQFPHSPNCNWLCTKGIEKRFNGLNFSIDLCGKTYYYQ